MTREEAKNIISWIEHGIHQDKDLNPYKLIDEIYDDFESMICENCRYFIDEKGTSMQFCNARTVGGVIGWNAYGRDFGCNKFERKGT